MNIRWKTLSFVVLLVLSLTSVLYFVAQKIMLDSINASEKKYVQNDVERFENALSFELRGLVSAVSDWAAWDDSYAFAENNNTQYISSNLVDQTFVNLKLNLMLFIDPSGQLIFGKAFDLINETEQPIDLGLLEQISLNSLLLDHNDTEGTTEGVILVERDPMLVASHPILTSLNEGPARGTLIMGRYLDATEIALLTQIAGFTLSVFRISDLQMPPDFLLANSTFSGVEQFFVQALNETCVGGYTLVQDTMGAPILIVRVEDSRDSYLQGQTSIQYFSISLLAFGLAFLAMTIVLLERFVLSRLDQLGRSVAEIGVSGNLSTRISMRGRDELSNLADKINYMLEAIQQGRVKLKEYAEHLEERVRERTKELEESQEKIKSILHASPDAIVALDANGNIIECNDRTYGMHGYDWHELIGKSFCELVSKKDRQRTSEYIGKNQDQGLAKTIECVLVKKGGCDFSAELSANALRDPKGNCIGSVVVVRDVTDRKKLEQKLFKSERFAVIGELAGMVGHDLRNPLTGIAGAIYYLKTKYNSKIDKKGKELVEIIEKDIKHSDKIISDLLEYSREIRLELTETTPKSMLNEAFSGVEIPENIQIEDETQNEPKMKIDAAKIRRVIVNIVNNAFDAMPEGGKLTLRSQITKNGVAISFSDTGVGISGENLNKLWTPLFTTKAKGMGFGLPICRRIVDAHGGNIFVESTVGKGSTFTLTLPIKPQIQEDNGEIWASIPETLATAKTDDAHQRNLRNDGQ